MAQVNSEIQSIWITGYIDTIPVFQNSFNNYSDLYSLNESDNSLKLFEKNKLQPKYKDYFIGYLYVGNDFRRYSLYQHKNPYPFTFEINNNVNIFYLGYKPNDEGYDIKNMKAYLSTESESSSFENYFSDPIKRLDLKTGKLDTLSIKGSYPVVVNDWLYYADYHDRKDHDLVYDIFRVRIGEWTAPEKLFEKAYSDAGYITPDGKYLLEQIIPKGTHKTIPILYSIEQKKYVKVEIPDCPRGVFYSYYKNALCFYDIELNENGERRFIYFDIPEKFLLSFEE